MENNLGRDSVPALVRRIALPSMLAQFVSVLYSIVDRMYIGNIPETGDLALAGAGVCGPVVTLIGSVAFLVGTGGAPLLSMKLGEGEIDERVREAARLTGVGEELFERSPLELSGGQKRRVAIAGVMAMRPRVLILDEPMAGLDPAGCAGIMQNITDYRRETGSTVLLVTHDMDDAAKIADRLIVFHEGAVAMDGAPDEVFSRQRELVGMGLDVPQSAAIADALRARGVALPASIYTLDQLRAALLALAKGVAGC